MMQVYYKYTKFFGIEQLKEPMLRISSPFTLNDPFEPLINSHVEQKLSNNVQLKHFKLSHIEDKLSPEQKKSIITSNINRLVSEYGIVSLSETPRNLLMWAHYSNEHSGVCIGFKPDLFDSQQKYIKTNFCAESYLPLKVNYDSCRPENIDDYIDASIEVQIQLRNQLLTKSNDWMYEKEHRCILPIEWADVVKINNHSLQYELIDIFKENKIIQETKPYTFEGNGITALSRALYGEKDILFLKKINPSNIVSIHLGCNMQEDHKELIINEIYKESSALNHIKIFEGFPSHDRFEIDFINLKQSQNKPATR